MRSIKYIINDIKEQQGLWVTCLACGLLYKTFDQFSLTVCLECEE